MAQADEAIRLLAAVENDDVHLSRPATRKLTLQALETAPQRLGESYVLPFDQTWLREESKRCKAPISVENNETIPGICRNHVQPVTRIEHPRFANVTR
ncbi:hypothetical protein WI89_32210 [Burkholderia ubonensis]|nr:hypothetical protein WI89_32210 [Burkholderia ubonensis]